MMVQDRTRDDVVWFYWSKLCEHKCTCPVGGLFKSNDIVSTILKDDFICMIHGLVITTHLNILFIITEKTRDKERKWDGVGVMKDKELNLKDVKDSHTLGWESCILFLYIESTEEVVILLEVELQIPRNLNTHESEECDHGKGVGVYTTLRWVKRHRTWVQVRVKSVDMGRVGISMYTTLL